MGLRVGDVRHHCVLAIGFLLSGYTEILAQAGAGPVRDQQQGGFQRGLRPPLQLQSHALAPGRGRDHPGGADDFHPLLAVERLYERIAQPRVFDHVAQRRPAVIGGAQQRAAKTAATGHVNGVDGAQPLLQVVPEPDFLENQPRAVTERGGACVKRGMVVRFHPGQRRG